MNVNDMRDKYFGLYDIFRRYMIRRYVIRTTEKCTDKMVLDNKKSKRVLRTLHKEYFSGIP